MPQLPESRQNMPWFRLIRLLSGIMQGGTAPLNPD
jgi:hypothetical protein